MAGVGELDSTMSRGPRIIASLFGTLLVLGGLTALLCLNSTAREVTLDSLGLAFAFFTTPFILEMTCLALFLMGLLAFNHWRLHKEGDGWVWLMTRETDDNNLPSAITQRLQSTVLTDKPEKLDESLVKAGVIEGYLELGMSAQALREIGDAPPPAGSQSSIEEVIIRIRVLAANLEKEAARQLVHATAAVHPESRFALAAACIENARWLLRHMHREDLAREWLVEAQKQDAGAGEIIAADAALRDLNGMD